MFKLNTLLTHENFGDLNIQIKSVEKIVQWMDRCQGTNKKGIGVTLINSSYIINWM